MTPRQQEMLVSWLNRAIAGTPFVVVSRQELEHEVRDSPGRDGDWYKRLGMGLIVSLLPYRYRLLAKLVRSVVVSVRRRIPYGIPNQ